MLRSSSITSYKTVHSCYKQRLIPKTFPNKLCHYQKYHETKLYQSTTTKTPTTSNATNKRWKAKLEEEILASINIKDPLLNKHLRTLGWIRNISIQSDEIRIQLKLPTLLHPHKSFLEKDITARAENVLNHVLKSNDDTNGLIVPLNVKVETSALPISGKDAMVASSSEEEEGEETSNKNKKMIGCEKINHFVAVYSCKGGVGKSTIAVNLAYTLAAMGGRVGLLDCDVYGPSLPTLVRTKDDNNAIKPSSLGDNFIHPIVHDGVKLLSLGFVSNKSGVPGSGSGASAAVMRGPMADKVISQLMFGTDWGELDILILDLPPGTGDIPISLLQSQIALSGVVSITTPSKLSLIDAEKGIEMFNSMGVQTLACIENMAYFDYKGDRLFPFGKGLLHLLDKQQQQQQTDSTSTSSLSNSSVWNDISKERIFSIPLSMQLNDANENGQPLCNTTTNHPNDCAKPQQHDDDSKIRNIYQDIALSISKELFLLQHGMPSTSTTTNQNINQIISIQGHDFDTSNIILSPNNLTKNFTLRLFSTTEGSAGAAMEIILHGNDLRIANPKTGIIDQGTTSKDKTPTVETSNMVTHHDHSTDSNNKQQQASSSSKHNHTDKKNNDDKWNLFPATVEKKGRHGYAVHWADGATIIYSMNSLGILATSTYSSK